MTIITIELPDDIANQAAQAGMLSPSAITQLIEAALATSHLDDTSFRLEVGASLAQADQADARWLPHEQVQMEWQAERSALLAGKPLDAAEH
jgi:hypothetical protein